MTFDDLIAAEWNRPFDWQSNHCALFAARCVDVQLGTTFEAKVRETFPVTNVRDYLHHVRVKPLEALVTEWLGPPISAAYLQKGDVVLMVRKRHEALAVQDAHQILLNGPRGVRAAPARYAVKGWRVQRA